MPDLAPGWQIRCPKCGWMLPYGEIGIRLGAASKGKRILARCPQCRRLRWVIVERVPSSIQAEEKN
jgi:DNA-directed RNA polymerase subunit RPC12/RpoP